MKKLIYIATILLVSVSAFAQVSEKEKDALTDLYVTTDGENWVNTWDLNAPIDTWYGVTVKDNSVVAINLLFNNLNGLIPDSLGDLENLENLELSFNKLTGNIPTTIGKLKSLKVFSLNGNKLIGTIPPVLGKLTNLEQLHLSSNNLEGTIPVALGNLQNLEVLNVFDNNLGGSVPYVLLESENLEKLVIAENELTNTGAFADVLLFEEDIDNPAFKNPGTFKPAKTVIATETSDDEN